MHSSLQLASTVEKRVIPPALQSFRAAGSMDMAFGGPVRAGGTGLEITELSGTRTRSVANLKVRTGSGIGGKALALGRPVSVTSYLSAQGITHAYDYVVRPERIETAAVLPVAVDGGVRWVIYLCSRSRVRLGERWFDTLAPLVRRLERDIAVEDEVRRRITLLQAASHSPGQCLTRADLVDIAAELEGLAGQIQDDTLRAKVEAVRRRLAPSSTPKVPGLMPPGAPLVALVPREIEVLQAVARGLSNREVGEALGLLPNTVKSYLKTAMQKLHVHNRVQATLAARDAGFIK